MLDLPPPLSPFRGKRIGEICSFSLGKRDDLNHCAHFVSHVMGYELGATTCKNQTFDDKQAKGTGATIRVDEIFNKSGDRGRWADRPEWQRSCLIFVTISSNVVMRGDEPLMGSHRLKHIGIYQDGLIWNYANGRDQVVADSERVFLAKFTHAYRLAGNTVDFYFGDFIKGGQQVPQLSRRIYV